MKNNFKLSIFLVLFLFSKNVFSGNLDPTAGVVDPPVVVHNQTDFRAKVSWHIDFPKDLKIIKYETEVAPSKSVTLEKGITYYSDSKSKSKARVQKNKVEIVAELLDKKGKKIKDENKSGNVSVFAKHEIAKDHLLTLHIYVKEGGIEFREVEKK